MIYIHTGESCCGSQINVFYVMYVCIVLYVLYITYIRREYVCTEYCKENGPHARRRKGVWVCSTSKTVMRQIFFFLA